MSSVTQEKAANVIAPYGDGTTTNVLFFTCTSTSRADVLPDEWAGKFVRLANETTNLAQFFISPNSSASCDETIAAANGGGAAAGLGDSIFGNTEQQFRLPPLPERGHLYFVRASVTSTSLRIRLASD
jgi:hypothetical protein